MVHKPIVEPFGKPQGENLEETHAGKGVLLVTDSNGLTVGNTHLYSPGTDGAVFTETQFRIILKLGAVYLQLVMAGDYYLPYKCCVELNAEYGAPFKIFDTDATYDPRISPLIRKGVNRFAGIGGERTPIDGLMVRGNAIKLRYSGVFRTPLYLTHYGVAGLLSVNNPIRKISLCPESNYVVNWTHFDMARFSILVSGCRICRLNWVPIALLPIHHPSPISPRCVDF